MVTEGLQVNHALDRGKLLVVHEFAGQRTISAEEGLKTSDPVMIVAIHSRIR
jgi:hypothetical protein